MKVLSGCSHVPRWRKGIARGDWRGMWQFLKGPKFLPRRDTSKGRDGRLPLVHLAWSLDSVEGYVSLTGAPIEGTGRVRMSSKASSTTHGEPIDVRTLFCRSCLLCHL